MLAYLTPALRQGTSECTPSGSSPEARDAAWPETEILSAMRVMVDLGLTISCRMLTSVMSGSAPNPARALVNAVLARGGVPFVVGLAASEAQRAAYRAALVAAHRQVPPLGTEP